MAFMRKECFHTELEARYIYLGNNSLYRLYVERVKRLSGPPQRR